MRIGVNDARSGSDTLQPDWLPHHHQFMVCAGRHDEQVAWLRCVNRRLNRVTLRQARRSLAADGESHRIYRLLAVSCRDDDFPATCGTAAVLHLLLHRAVRHLVPSCGQRGHDRRITPTRDVRGYASDRHASPTLRRTETVMASDGLFVPWRCGCPRPRIRIVVDILITQSMDRDWVGSPSGSNVWTN